MSPRTAAALLGFASAAACAHERAAGPSVNPAELVPSTIELVEEVRGLRAKTPIAVHVLDTQAFAATLAEHETADHADIERLRASWVAFGLVPPSLDLSASLHGVFDEQVVGFYDPKAKALYVRSSMPAFGGVDAVLLTRGVLAHEIEHALQDQLLMPLDDSSPGNSPGDSNDEEATLARTALVEGDAQLTMLAAVAKLQKQPLEMALGNVALMTRFGPDVLARMSGFSSKLLEAPPVLRETLTFPYIAGLKFAGSLWQAGGFDLVNRAFHSPPVSASQILHPNRYSKDLRPRPIPALQLPSGWSEKDSGSAGELGTLSVLEQCLPRGRAEGAAAALAGDRYVVGKRPDGRLGLIWLSVWPTRKAADQFALDMIEEEPCWDKNRGDGKGSVGSEVQIRVAAADSADPPAWVEMEVLRGIPPAETKGVVAALEKITPGPPPVPKPPFGEGFRLKPIAPAVPEVRHGRLSGSSWTDDGLGVAATVPPGWIGKTSLPGIALLIVSATGSHDNGIYGYIPAPLDPALERQLTGALTATFEAAMGNGQKLHPEAEERITREGVRGMESRWTLPDSDLEVRIRVLPVCAGKGTAMLATFAHGGAVAGLTSWVESFRIGKPGPMCP